MPRLTEQEQQGIVRLIEANGRLLQMVNDLRRMGRIAFDGQAEIIARFNKDILLRGRRARKSAGGINGHDSQDV